jgi:hypothetical protein
MISLGFNQLYPTTVLLGEISNSEIVADTRDLLLSNPNLSALANSHGGYDPLSKPEFREFRDQIVMPSFYEYLDRIGITDEYKIKSWITGYGTMYDIGIHNHSGSHYTSIFYLYCSDEDCGGELIMLDPRVNANRGYLPQHQGQFKPTIYSPKTGEYIVFPSYLYHHTTTFTGKLRLALVVDLFFQD